MSKLKKNIIIGTIITIISIYPYNFIASNKFYLRLEKNAYYLLGAICLNEKIEKTIKNIKLEEATFKERKVLNRKINYNNENLGTYGRLYFPSINLSVAVYSANLVINENYNAQAIVDRVDSAAYFNIGNKGVIGDHNYQGFNKILNLSIGASAYIKRKNGLIENYKMINKFPGKNISNDLIDLNGNSVNNYNGQLIIYTCYNSSNEIILTIWDKI